jgi:hypothetical protein
MTFTSVSHLTRGGRSDAEHQVAEVDVRSTRRTQGQRGDLACPVVEGRSARLFERERRQTYQAVPHVLLPGTHVFDRRADGSILEITIPPAAQTGATIEAGNSAPPEVQASSAGEIPVRRAIAAPARSKA